VLAAFDPPFRSFPFVHRRLSRGRLIGKRPMELAGFSANLTSWDFRATLR
jgi:hypothetical protein